MKKTTSPNQTLPVASNEKQVTTKSAVRRPSESPSMSQEYINEYLGDLGHLKTQIEQFAAHMRALDRKRLNGLGIKRQGFTDRAFALAQDNEEFLPHWLPMDKFREDVDQFLGLRNLVDITKQIEEMLWNLTVQASDMAYTDALEFYSQIKDASRRRVDAAESPYAELRKFFERMGPHNSDKPTQAEVERDVRSLLKGRKDGKVVVENVRPKTTGGSRKVVAETFKDSVHVKDTAEADVTE